MRWSCRQARKWMLGVADGWAWQPVQRWVKWHLARCQKCAALWRQHERLTVLLHQAGGRASTTACRFVATGGRSISVAFPTPPRSLPFAPCLAVEFGSGGCCGIDIDGRMAQPNAPRFGTVKAFHSFVDAARTFRCRSPASTSRLDSQFASFPTAGHCGGGDGGR